MGLESAAAGIARQHTLPVSLRMYHGYPNTRVIAQQPPSLTCTLRHRECASTHDMLTH